MADQHRDHVGLADPEETWAALSEGEPALLVDVRTRAEWTFVGAPDLSPLGAEIAFIEWLNFPDMRPNPRFLEALSAATRESGATRVYFLCRSGARSQAAAEAAAAAFAEAGRPVACFNVIEGFEGDPDGDGRRGRVNGWKARGLPWRQS